MNKMSVDPGLNTAYAIWDEDIELIDTGVFRIRSGKYTSEKKLCDLWRSFNAITRKSKITECCIEGVQVWMGSTRSVTAASTGKLMLLSYLVGGYCHICHLEGISFRIINPTEWKGQMSKEVVKRRVERALGQNFDNEHIVDAIGLGLSTWGDL